MTSSHTARSRIGSCRRAATAPTPGEITAATMARSPARVSRRAQLAAGIAVRLLPPAHRQRYREEFAAELAELPHRDQAPHAYWLMCNVWSSRRSLTGTTISFLSVRLVVVVVPTAGGAVLMAQAGWPALALGGLVIFAVMWTVSSADRTQRLVSLISAVRAATRGREDPT